MSTQAIHSKLRSLESDADRLLSQYSSLTQNPTSPSSVPDDLATNLSTRTAEIDEFARIAGEPDTPAAAQHQLQRHREVLKEHRAISKRLAEQLAQERNRRNLLSSVRSDIESHRTRSPENTESYFLDERNRVENSNSMADRLLAEAYETRADFMQQQATLKNVQRRIWTVFSSVPGINSVISKINTRQKRNSLVLATVITVCILLLVFFH